MTRFLNYLNEMSTTDALSLFGLNSNDITPEKIKKKFRELSKIHHPDKGGSEYDQKRVNDAYDTLKTFIKTPGSSSSSKFDWKEIDKKYKDLAKIVNTYLYDKFNQNNFIKYFSDITDKQITFEITKTWPRSSDNSPTHAGFECEFFDKERSFVFTIQAIVYLTNMKNSKALGGGDQYSFDILTESYTFAYNKKHKIGIKKFNNISDHRFLSDPTMFFPQTKIKKIVKGDTSIRKFSKRDMILFLEKKLKATSLGSDEFKIPLANDMSIFIYRRTFMKTGSWYFNTFLYQKNKNIGKINGYTTFYETEETAKKFELLYKELLKYNDPGKVINKIEDFIKQEKIINNV